LVTEKLKRLFVFGDYWLGENYMREFVRLMTMEYVDRKQKEPTLKAPRVEKFAGKLEELDPDKLLLEEAKVSLFAQTKFNGNHKILMGKLL
jgi:hypothetical protein